MHFYHVQYTLLFFYYVYLGYQIPIDKIIWNRAISDKGYAR